MKKNQDYDFYIFIKENFEQTISFVFHNSKLKKFGYLDNQPEFSSSKKVQKLIEKISKVQNGELETISLYAEDALSVKIYKDIIIAYDYMHEHTKSVDDENQAETTHNTSEFVEFLNQWKLFLEKYENNEIPNLNNPNSKKK